MIRTPISVARSTVVVLTAMLMILLVGAAPAAAAPADKLDVLSRWTQPSAASASAWNAARANRAPWSAYGFDWSTDICSASPDRPLGFDFTLPCRRHDFGYRNYRAARQFAANKARVDNAFHADLRRRCATYAAAVRPACLSLAWTYYRAVHLVGSLAAVTEADLDRAEDIRSGALRATAAR
jgi:hypothetical protein